MNHRWMLYRKDADFYQIGEQFHIDPVIARVIRNREIIGEQAIMEYLAPNVAYLYSPWLLAGMEEAVNLLLDKILLQHKIRIIADYDVDGIMSNYILYKGLIRAGGDVDYYIPDRVVDGYGINEDMIEAAHEAGINTIVTCDNGIAARDAIKRAKELSMTVVVTDHHEVPFEEINGVKQYQLPDADCIIDPKRMDCTYPLEEICGAAVAYKLIEGIFERKGIDKKELYPLLEYVGIATICDVMPLLDENRCFVRAALDLLNHTENEGLRALIAVNDLQGKQITEYHIGFVLGPCMNATGRLDTAMLSMELLLAEEKAHAMELAGRLYELNAQRKEMTEQFTEQAVSLVENSEIRYDKVLVVYLPECHESIAGILAGRLRERYYRPAIVLTMTAEGLLKGSGRSIEEYNMCEGLAACQEYLLKFGGHAMAAGLTLELARMEELRRALNSQCMLDDSDMVPTLHIDVPMPIHYVSFALIEQLELLAPFGRANEKPLFAEAKLKVISARVLGKTGNVLKLVLENETGASCEAIYYEVQEFLDNIRHWFGADECDQILHGWLNNVVLDVVYYPTINEYNGTKSVQLRIRYYRKHEELDEVN